VRGHVCKVAAPLNIWLEPHHDNAQQGKGI
jgi:hypothetical protein